MKTERKDRQRERETGRRAHAPLLGGRADSTADRPRAGSSVSITVSYKSSAFTLFSSAAHKLIKLAFPCCFWQTGRARRPERCIVGGRRVYKPVHTDTYYYSVSMRSTT